MLKMIHTAILLIFPVAIYLLIFVGIYEELGNKNNTNIDSYLQPLFIFLVASRIMLLCAFITSGFLLLRTIRSYSLQLYR